MALEFKELATDKLRRGNIPEFNDAVFTPSTRMFKNSGRSMLSEGTLVIGENKAINVVVKSLSKFYAIGRRKHTETEQFKEKLLEYFAREAEVCIRARGHPNILTMIGFMPSFQHDPFPAFVFPFLPMGDLRRYISRNGSNINIKTRLQFLLDVAHGLQYLHDLQPPIVHRDLTATNVLLNSHSERIVACLNDFGSAKLMDPTLSIVCSSSESLTYKWAPPEYVKKKTYMASYTNPQPSGDVWSFACVFLEVLTGSDPWPPGCEVVTELRDGHCPPQPVDVKIKKNHWKFLEGCWKVRPSKRYSTKQLVDNLDRFLADEE